MKEEVYKNIENHYREHFTEQVKKLRGVAGGLANAEDIVQEAYARACQYWNSYNSDKSFNAWFNRILVNCLTDYKRYERAASIGEETAGENDVFPSGALSAVTLKEVKALVNGQPDNVRDILNLYLFKQYTGKEISEVVEEKHGNVRFIIHQFRKKLRERFGDIND